MPRPSRRKLVLLIAAPLAVLGLALAVFVFEVQTLLYDDVVNEAFAAGEARELSSGEFHGVAHDGSGVARVFELPDGRRVLRLEDLDVSNGPDLYVYLVAVDDARDSDTVDGARLVSLGELKGNQGNQSYAIPDDADLGELRSVTIWCKRFGVNFATAPLTPRGRP